MSYKFLSFNVLAPKFTLNNWAFRSCNRQTVISPCLNSFREGYSRFLITNSTGKSTIEVMQATATVAMIRPSLDGRIVQRQASMKHTLKNHLCCSNGAHICLLPLASSKRLCEGGGAYMFLHTSWRVYIERGVD